MAEENIDTSLANQDEKNNNTKKVTAEEPKAPAVSHAQLQMMNVNLQKQLSIAQTVLLDISETLAERGTEILNMSQNIKNLFRAPKGQPQNIPKQPAK